MSKNKKTIEQLLEEVIVPEEEQPYEVPNNWVWSNAGAVSKTLRGVSYKKNQVEGQKNDNNLLVLRGGNIQDGTILNQDDNVYVSNELVKEEQKLQKNDVVIVSSTGSSKVIGKAASVINEFVGESFGAFLTAIRPSEKIDSSYFGLYYQTTNYRNMISSLAKGSNINNIKKEHLDNLSFPLPPFYEQKRIVEKVGSLLSKIEESKKLIEKAKKTFELRRAAILEKAFRGELTRNWRAENGVKLEDWVIVDFDEVAFAIDPQPSHRTPAISDDGIPYIGVKDCNYETGEIDFINARPVSKSVLDEHINRYGLNNGDFIIGKIGTVGKPFIIPTERNYVLSANVILIQPKTEMVIPKYLYYLFQSSHIENQLNAGMNATTQAAFGIKKVRKLNVNLCSLNEQQKIVEILDSIFVKETRAKEINIQIDNLKTSILQKAFQGKLGTNDSREENAIELLKVVLQEQME
ncbi:restriction endonuclease subunit S [Priestia flexa]|uniref:restriction endonuclease subunit S n=1 Tax=Priestia flexa TaxID=86664 RepID=UPI0013D2343F|nr:restriction endonuclease subunit S [Priestia flexa]